MLVSTCSVSSLPMDATASKRSPSGILPPVQGQVLMVKFSPPLDLTLSTNTKRPAPVCLCISTESPQIGAFVGLSTIRVPFIHTATAGVGRAPLAGLGGQAPSALIINSLSRALTTALTTEIRGIVVERPVVSLTAVVCSELIAIRRMYRPFTFFPLFS